MRFFVDSAIFSDFPSALIGVVVARDLDNAGSSSALAPLLLEAQAAAVRALGDSSITEHPHVACWREAYRKFGAKPKKYPSSIENLVRRAVKGEPLRSINKLVDVYNVVSLTHLLPCGGEDLDAVQGDVQLTRASDDEPDVVLLGESEGRPPQPGEIIYRDDVGAICRRWNWKEADRTKLTETTRNAVLVIEALPPVTREYLERALGDLEAKLRDHVGGELTRAVLDRDHAETALDA